MGLKYVVTRRTQAFKFETPNASAIPGRMFSEKIRHICQYLGSGAWAKGRPWPRGALDNLVEICKVFKLKIGRVLFLHRFLYEFY